MKHVATTLLIVVMATSSMADTNDLNRLIAEALSSNPAIHAAQARFDAASTRPEQAGALKNPTFKYESDVVDQMESSYEVEQQLPGWGKRDLRSKLAMNEAAMSSWEAEETRQTIILQVKEAYHRLHAARQTLSFLGEQADVLKKMDELVHTRYSTGSAEQSDILKVASERTLLAQQRLILDGDELEWLTRLNQALGRPHMDPIPPFSVEPTPPLSLDMTQLEKWTLEHNPEYQRSLIVKEQSETALQLAQKDGSPDWMLGAKYQEQEDRDGATMVMVGIDLPIWRGRIRSTIKESRHAMEATERDAELIKRHHVAEIESQGVRLARMEEVARVYRVEFLPQAQQRYEATQTAYQTGRGDFWDMLEAQRFWLDAQITCATADADLSVELATLEFILGAPLETALSPETK